MSAAIEGAMEGIPSLGFSLADFDFDADFKASSIIASKIIKGLSIDFPKNSCLNINIQNYPLMTSKGLKYVNKLKLFGMIDLRKEQINSEMIIIG